MHLSQNVLVTVHDLFNEPGGEMSYDTADAGVDCLAHNEPIGLFSNLLVLDQTSWNLVGTFLVNKLGMFGLNQFLNFGFLSDF